MKIVIASYNTNLYEYTTDTWEVYRTFKLGDGSSLPGWTERMNQILKSKTASEVRVDIVDIFTKEVTVYMNERAPLLKNIEVNPKARALRKAAPATHSLFTNLPQEVSF
jgi:hypothetical protein